MGCAGEVCWWGVLVRCASVVRWWGVLVGCAGEVCWWGVLARCMCGYTYLPVVTLTCPGCQDEFLSMTFQRSLRRPPRTG